MNHKNFLIAFILSLFSFSGLFGEISFRDDRGLVRGLHALLVAGRDRVNSVSIITIENYDCSDLEFDFNKYEKLEWLRFDSCTNVGEQLLRGFLNLRVLEINDSRLDQGVNLKDLVDGEYRINGLEHLIIKKSFIGQELITEATIMRSIGTLMPDLKVFLEGRILNRQGVIRRMDSGPQAPLVGPRRLPTVRRENLESKLARWWLILKRLPFNLWERLFGKRSARPSEAE